jgi:hypothetical protein
VAVDCPTKYIAKAFCISSDLRNLLSVGFSILLGPNERNVILMKSFFAVCVFEYCKGCFLPTGRVMCEILCYVYLNHILWSPARNIITCRVRSLTALQIRN